MTTVIALPGFTRGPEHLQRLADACGAHGLTCVRPALAPRWMPALYMVRSRLHRLARRLAARGVTSAVIVGHSAGAAAGCQLARCLRDAGVHVQGIVLVDGVDSPNHLIRRSLPHLADVPVAAVLAPPSRCNRQGQLARDLVSFPWVTAEVIPGAGHGDIEGAGLDVYRRFCGDTSDSVTADAVLATVMRLILRMADRPQAS